jgi:hypothetical protein
LKRRGDKFLNSFKVVSFSSMLIVSASSSAYSAFFTFDVAGDWLALALDFNFPIYSNSAERTPPASIFLEDDRSELLN